MRPIVVTTTVPRPREQVFAYLDVMANHEALLDHMARDFTYDGPPGGVGARMRSRSKLPGPADWTEFEVVAAQAPRRTVEQGLGAGGKRRTQGTYELDERPDGTTHVTFELRVLALPLRERLLAPLLGRYLRRSMQTSMEKLRERVAALPEPASA